MDLHVDADELNACIQCGLCLPHCPTYRVSGDELLSPRGRIRLMREVNDHDVPVTAEVVDAFATCVQCRGCEPACPSGVPYGNLIEQTREALVDNGLLTSKILARSLGLLAYPRLLRALSGPLAIAARLGVVPRRFGLPRNLPIRRKPLPTSGHDLYLFTGCVMDAWQRDVHQATLRVIAATGAGVTPTGDAAPCCGALHSHAGLGAAARQRAEATIRALSVDDRPILVNSAGCGAALKDYGRLLGTPEAHAFASRVRDVHEWLADRMETLPAPTVLPVSVAVQDPCHLRHVQRVHPATRQVLAPFVDQLVELDDDGLCCGAGGAYSLLQPQLATAMRQRKGDAIARANPDLVASANPGCVMHLSAGQIEAQHPMQLIDWALHGGFERRVTVR